MQSNQIDQHPIQRLEQSRANRLVGILTSFYAIALAVAAASIILFSWLADEVMEHEFASLNTSVLLAIHRHDTDILTNIAFIFTDIGSVIGVTVLCILFALFLWKKHRHADLATLAAVIIGASLLVYGLKLLFHEPRPEVFVPLAVEKSFSFPSGHSLISFSFWGFFAWWIISLGPREVWRWLIALVAIAVAACVALSRLYLGVHWPTDVLAGMILGFGWVALCVTGQYWLTRHSRAERRQQVRERQRTAPISP